MTSRTVAVDVTMTGNTVCEGPVTTSARFIKRVAIANTETSYTITTDDYLIGCDTVNNAITITLPLASTAANQTFYVVDETGDASTNNITIATSGSDTLNGAPNKIISTDYTSIQIYSDGGTGYHIM